MAQEDRLDRIERMMEENARQIAEMNRKTEEWRQQISQAMTDLVKLHVQTYPGPWEPASTPSDD